MHFSNYSSKFFELFEIYVVSKTAKKNIYIDLANMPMNIFIYDYSKESD